MTVWLTKKNEKGETVLSEKYDDAEEMLDAGPTIIPGERRAEARSLALETQLRAGEEIEISSVESERNERKKRVKE